MVKRRIRNVIKQVFLSEEENQKLLEKMKHDGFTNFSLFARRQLLKSDFETWLVSFPEYQPLTDRLLSVGRTINGIAKSATQFGKISQHDLTELGQLMEELVELVEKQVKEKFSNRNLLEMLDKPINQIKNFKINESVETYYASEGSGGIRLLKILNQLKKTLQQNRSFL